MKLFTSIRNKAQQAPKKALLTLAGLLVLVGVPASMALAEFYPDRPTFDYNVEAQRVGSMNGPVFNSFINTPSYGDERSFVDARRSDQTASGSYKNVLPDVTDGSKEIVVRMYVHNNANQSTNADGSGIARNTKVRVSVPTATSNVLRARGYISADNATPKVVEDTVDFTAAEDFTVAYIPGSAQLFDNDNFANGVKLSDSIVTTGAPIGSDALDGNMKGCFEFEAVVQVRLKVTPKANPDIDFTKEVAVPGQNAWGERVDVKPGDTVKWLISFANKGQVDLNNVTISDKLPPHLQLVPGSVRYIDAAQEVAQQDGPLFTTGGINFTTWKPNGGFYVRFETTAKDDFQECEVAIRNIAYNDTDQTEKIEDFADVVIKKDNCQPPEEEEQPVYSCDSLSSPQLVSGLKYRFTTDTTAKNGATVKQYKYEFTGDDYRETSVTNKENGEIEHTFPRPGDYVISVSVDFDVDGEVKSDNGAKCKTALNIPTTPTPPTPQAPPVTPTTLPNTGVGSLFGIFTVTTAAGAMAHRAFQNRRNRF